ncbi:MAG: hypothetical protein RBJ76_06040 [Stenomitos frigidus ULC029]
MLANAEFYVANGQGKLDSLKRYSDWSQTWDFIISGDFGGSSATDLLFYDRSNGLAEFQAVNTGSLSLLQKYSGWRKTWSAIVPGNFGGSLFTDLLLYDRTNGEAEFRTINGGNRLVGE